MYVEDERKILVIFVTSYRREFSFSLIAVRKSGINIPNCAVTILPCKMTLTLLLFSWSSIRQNIRRSVLRDDRLLVEEIAQMLSCSCLQDRVVLCTFQVTMVA